MTYLKILSLGLCLLSTVAVADPKTEMMQDKLDRLEAEMALIQRKIYQQPQNQPVTPQPLETPKNIDDFYTQIDAQNQIIQDLTAQLEQTNHHLTDLTDKFNRMQQDVEFRFQNMNKFSESENLTQTQPEKKEVVKPKISDKEAYDKAYAQLKDGKYPEAEQSFLAFMENYPDSKLLGNANYWLAETYYARSQWAEASGLFADGFTKFKDNAKAPDSMLKLGLTMKQMGKNKEACAAFKGLSGEFKNLSDNLKKRAEQEIKELKCP